VALPTSFFERSPARVARDLLGHRVVAPGPDGGEVAVRVVETEAYGGPSDPASHARHGREARGGCMWEAPGRAYVYVCYGVHQMLNVVAHEPGEVGAVLVRAGEPAAGAEAMRARRGDREEPAPARGPGNLTEALGVTREANDGARLDEAPGVRFERGDEVPAEAVRATGRVGVSEGARRRLRFLVAASPAVSRPRP